LHLPASYGHVETMKSLVELSADMEAKAAVAATPLHAAVRYSHREALKTLMELSTNIETKAAGGMTWIGLCLYCCVEACMRT
jgi:ankyrin repeat protein